MNIQANMVGIDKAQQIISRRWDRALERNKKPKPIMIHGSMGLGKSSIVHQYARTRNYRVVDLRGTGMEAPDALGLGFVNHTTEELRFSTPEWWPKDDDEIVIIFLDELTNCTKSVQQAFYRLVLDRQIQNGKRLSDNVIIVGAGNMVSDGTGAKPLIPALANRFALHLIIDESLAPDAFMKWGMKNTIHDNVLAYIAHDPDALIESPNHEAFARPRTWEEVSDVLHDFDEFGGDNNELRIEIAGAVGTKQSTKFLGWMEYNKILPNWKEVADGKPYKMPDDNEARFNIAAHLALQCIKYIDNSKGFLRLLKIADELDDECLIVFFRLLKSDPVSFVEVLDYDEVPELFERVADHIK